MDLRTSTPRIPLATLLALTLSIGCASPTARQRTLDRVADEQITAASLIETVAQLSAPEMAGRLPGHEGYDRAAALMADRFAEEVRLMFLTAAEIADGRYDGEPRQPPRSSP